MQNSEKENIGMLLIYSKRVFLGSVTLKLEESEMSLTNSHCKHIRMN